MIKDRAIIFDLDGTLANCDHRLHHIKGDKKDWDSFFNEIPNDTLNKGVLELWNFIPYKRVIVTGRPIKYAAKTNKWLTDKGIYADEVIYRSHKDFRNDDIVKKELYEDHLKDRYDVKFVVEDRDRVVKMWRSLGFTCFQCAEGEF